jgi:hypothetical protein
VNTTAHVQQRHPTHTLTHHSLETNKLTRHRTLGAYWSYLLGGSAPGEQSVSVIILDTRFHRDSHVIPSLAGICLSICLSSVSTYLSSRYLPVYLSVYLSVVCLYLSLYLSVVCLSLK